MTTDFQKIIKELKDAGYTDIQIARLCDCTRQNIWAIGRGDTKDVGFRIGRRLEKLHEGIQ